MNPMRNTASLGLEAGSGTMDGGTGIEVGASEESKRIARFRTFTRSGKSVDDLKSISDWSIVSNVIYAPGYILTVHVSF